MNEISVIVPVWGTEKYLSKCLDSLVHQTIVIKIIVINDSTQDNSQTIIDEYKLNYPDLIDAYIKPNGGIADTRNFGVSQVNTPYFGFVDSDDYVELDMYEKLLTKAKNENADVTVCNFWWVYDNEKKLGIDGPYKPQKDMLVNLMATLWNKLYKTEIIKAIPVEFPTGYRYEDAFYLYCITPYLSKVAFVDEPLVHYIQREGSITHNHNDKVKDMIHVFEALIAFYKKENLYVTYEKELEYLFIKFFLGNSFLRTVQIKDKAIREETLKMSIDLLYKQFPTFYKNEYLNSLGGMKNKYFKLVRKWNYKLFAFVFGIIKR